MQGDVYLYYFYQHSLESGPDVHRTKAQSTLLEGISSNYSDVSNLINLKRKTMPVAGRRKMYTSDLQEMTSQYL